MGFAYRNDLSVPPIDSVGNGNIVNVIGNKADTHDGNSLYSLLKSVHDHYHSPQKVYPTLADGVTLTAHANDWVLGTLVQVVPASAIATQFGISEVVIEDLNVQDKAFELVLYSGSGDVEIGRTRFSSSTLKGGVPCVEMNTSIVAANERIRAALAVEDGGGKTVNISLRYHTY